MTDLRALFTSADLPDSVPDETAGQGARLRELVGASHAHTSVRDRPRFDGVSDLVGEAPTAVEAPRIDVAELVHAVGGPSSVSAGRARVPVSEAAVTPGWQDPAETKAGRRPFLGGRRKPGAVNFISIAIASLAMVALVGTASFAVIQRASANPADDAMVSLREREAELRNDTEVLRTANGFYASSVQEGAALAESGAAVLSGLTDRVAAAPLGAAESARGALAQSVASAEQYSVPEYQRIPLDEKSFDQVGDALDEVREAREVLPPLLGEVRQARSFISSAIDQFRAELRNVGAAIESDAPAQLASNEAAVDAVRQAYTDTVRRIREAQAAGGDGLAELSGYSGALDALRADNARVLALRAEEEQEGRTPTRPAPPQGTSPAPEEPPAPTEPEPTTPPQPTDPPTTEPQPEETPPPTEPSTPAEPPVEGGDSQ